MTFDFDRAGSVHDIRSVAYRRHSGGAGNSSGVCRCVIKLQPAADGHHGGICLRCAAFMRGLREAIDAVARTRLDGDERTSPARF